MNFIFKLIRKVFALKKKNVKTSGSSIVFNESLAANKTEVEAVTSITMTRAPMILSTRVDRSKLYPHFALIVEKFEAEVASIGAYLFDGFRSFEDQLAQYKKGREFRDGKWVVVDPKLIVTRAQPGMSFHNYGTAIDMAFDADKSKEGIQWTWDDKMPWKELGKKGKSYGLEWAGDWLSFPELPHFQMTYGYKIHQLYDVLTTAKTLKEGLIKCWNLFDKAI